MSTISKYIPTLHNLDPDGDLELKVRPITTFRVDSRSLARTSPVWKKMLFGGFAESKPDNKQPWIVSLPEDDPKALGILLAIVHSKFSEVPAWPSLDEIFQLTITTQKYDISNILRPWARSWADSLRGKPVCGITTLEQYGKRIWISWELGDLEIFEASAQGILQLARVDTRGTLLDDLGKPLHRHIFLSTVGILECISKQRQDIIQSALDSVDKYMNALLNDEKPDLCKASTFYNRDSAKHKRDCASVVYTSLARALLKAGLYPIPKSNSVSESIKEFKAKILSVLDGVETMGTDTSHKDCSAAPELRKTIDRVMNRKFAVASSTHVLHLVRQAAKTGC